MSKKFQPDEFDAVVEHGGRHREARTTKHRIFEWLRIFVAAAVVASIGYVGLKIADNNVIFTESLNFGSSQNEAQLKVTVLDGSNIEGAVSVAGESLIKSGYALGDVSELVDLDKNQVDIATTVVIALTQDDLAEAAKIAKILGPEVQVVLSSEYPGPITVLLGADYQIPETE